MLRLPKRHLFTALLTLAPAITSAGEWQLLPSSPFGHRFDDLHFISPEEGWAVNAFGEIWHTDDGGDSWTRQFAGGKEFIYFRSVGFANELVGWAGTLTTSTPLYATVDGGDTWAPVSNLPDPAPVGICGISVVDENTMFAVGVWSGPGYILRTTDGGASWTGDELTSDTAVGLIDVRFTDAMNGMAVGGVGPDLFSGSSVILRTQDGGDTWEEHFTGTIPSSWCWKISFPSTQLGYVSVERLSSPHHFLKTVDGGATWTEQPFIGGEREQGIGFVTEQLGWIGASDAVNPTYVTENGGATWAPAAFGLNLNRFQFFGTSLGYAAGDFIYKYTDGPVAVGEALASLEPITRGAPNPFRPRTTISYSLPRGTDVRIFVADAGGRLVRSLVSDHRAAGRHEVEWDGTDDAGRSVAAGIYLYVIRSDALDAIGKLVKVD